MLEEDRILEEQKHFDLEGAMTPRHRSPNHSIHEVDVNAWISKDRVNSSAEDETLPLISSQTMTASVDKSKDPVEDVSLNLFILVEQPSFKCFNLQNSRSFQLS